MDVREIGISEYFEQYNCKVHKKMLVCGDFLVSDRVCIERKTTPDFIKSIIDGRLFQQMKLLKDNFEKPLLIIEGENVSKKLYENMHPNTVRGALASITIDYGVPIIWTVDPAETAGIIFWIAKREQEKFNREPVLRVAKKADSDEKKQEYLIAGLPDISLVRSKALLKKLETPKAVFSASEDELKEVEGIGPKIAKKIRELLDKKYESV